MCVYLCLRVIGLVSACVYGMGECVCIDVSCVDVCVLVSVVMCVLYAHQFVATP